MKLPIALFLCFLASPALATEPSKDDVLRLASKPYVQVINHVCIVQGAVWALGPRADVSVALVDDEGKQAFTAKTDKSGMYFMRVPMGAKTLALREVLLSPIGIKKEFAKDARIGTSVIQCQA
jgi:hypothetical protein